MLTTAPRLATILYDGHCRFCIAQMKKLRRWLPPGGYEALSFQDEGVLERFPGLTHEMAMEAMQLVDPRGRVFSGMEAAVRAVSLRRPIGWLALAYYLPGLRHLLDWIYRRIARNRYALMGKDCDGGTCSLHQPGR